MKQIDKKFDFLKEGEIGILFGRPAIGKTAMAYNILLRAARNGSYGFYYSMDQTNEELSKGMIMALGGIGRSEIFGINLESKTNEKLLKTANAFNELPIYLMGDFEPNLDLIIKDLKTRELPSGSLIVVDYLQLAMSAEDSNLLGSLSGFAASCGLKVLVLSQHQRIDDGQKATLRTCMASTSKQTISFAQRVGIVLRESFYQDKIEEKELMQLEFFKPEKETLECTFYRSSGRIE